MFFRYAQATSSIDTLQYCRFVRHVTGIGRELAACCHCTGTRGHGKSVASLILRMSRMTLYPMERNPVHPVKVGEPHPQVRILHLRVSLALPAFQPALVYCIDHIGRVAVDMDLGIVPPYGLESLDDGKKFHAVVGREAESPRHFHLPAGTFEDHTVATGARVSA